MRSRLSLCVGAASILLVAAILIWAKWSCSYPQSLALKAGWIKDFAPLKQTFQIYPRSQGCAELWFNRYQSFLGSLFGSLLAIIAALIASHFAVRQIEISRNQFAASVQPFLLAQAQAFADESSALDKINSFYLQLSEIAQDFKNVPLSLHGVCPWKKGATDLLSEAEKVLPTYEYHVTKYPLSDHHNALRLTSLRHFSKTLSSLKELNTSFEKSWSNVSWSINENMQDKLHEIVQTMEDRTQGWNPVYMQVEIITRQARDRYSRAFEQTDTTLHDRA
jgi:hypothetical protein